MDSIELETRGWPRPTLIQRQYEDAFQSNLGHVGRPRPELEDNTWETTPWTERLHEGDPALNWKITRGSHAPYSPGKPAVLGAGPAMQPDARRLVERERLMHVSARVHVRAKWAVQGHAVTAKRTWAYQARGGFWLYRPWAELALSLPSSKSIFSQSSKEKCLSEVVRNGTKNHLSSEWAMKSQVLHTAWCSISGEAAGEFRSWSLLVEGLGGLTWTNRSYLRSYSRSPGKTRHCTEIQREKKHFAIYVSKHLVFLRNRGGWFWGFNSIRLILEAAVNTRSESRTGSPLWRSNVLTVVLASGLPFTKTRQHGFHDCFNPFTFQVQKTKLSNV